MNPTRLRITGAAALDRLWQSFFVVPLLGMLAGVGLGLGMLAVDRAVGPTLGLPLVLTSTVENGRAMLGTIATATISVAGIAFSVSLLILQQASAQFSPRVVHGLFRDPFNRRVMAVALGTFSYSLTVLRAVRDLQDTGRGVVVPTLSITVAQVLGLAAVVAIVALIDHIAHTMEVSAVLERVLHQARTVPAERDGEDGGDGEWPARGSGAPAFEVRADRDGWVQHLDRAALLGLVPSGGRVRVDTGVGRFVIKGAPLLTLCPAPDDPDRAVERARGAVLVGAGRTLMHDPAYGIRQLVDVALIALSPGVNDPTTAHDAVLHATALLRDLLEHPLRRVIRDDRGRVLLLPRTPTAADLVALTFAEVRRAAAALPAVCGYLLECLHELHRSLPADVREDAVIATALREQARLVVDGAAAADPLPEDLTLVTETHDRLFGRPAPAARDGHRG